MLNLIFEKLIKSFIKPLLNFLFSFMILIKIPQNQLIFEITY